MPDLTEGGNTEFVSFLKNCKTVEEVSSGKYVIVRGTVFRSGDVGFALTTADGQMIELDASAVDNFKVVAGGGTHPEVELSVQADALKNAKSLPFKPVFKDIHTDPITNKVTHKDIHTDPISDQTLFVLDHKHVPKDHITDPLVDPIGTGAFDPIGGTAAETLIEGGFDPGQVVTNPVDPQGVGLAQGMTPFVMATPHHAPSQMVNMQLAAAQQRVGVPGAAPLKPLQTDTLKEISFDHTFKEIAHDTQKELVFDTLKEAMFDTHKELIFDTRKEVIETLVEGGGTIQEGGGQIPGGFPGMPGF